MAALLVGLWHALEDLLEFLLQGLDSRLDLLAHPLGQRVEDLGLDDLALVRRCHDEARRRAHDGDVLLLGALVQDLEGLLLPRAELLLDGASAGLVVLALERGGERGPQFIDDGDHGLRQRFGPAGRQANRAGLIRVLEIVDVDPVADGGCLTRLARQILVDRRAFAGRRRAQHENVEVATLHVRAELDGAQRPLLADEAGDRLKVFRAGEAEAGRIDGPAQFRGGQRLRGFGRCRRGLGGHLDGTAGLGGFGLGVGLITLEEHRSPLLISLHSGA